MGTAITRTMTMVSKTLAHYIATQVQFQEVLIQRKYGKPLRELTPQERNQILKDMVLSIHSESSELLDVATNWKLHKPDHPIDRARALEEYVDLFKFVINVFVYMGFFEDEFNWAFDLKTGVVWGRLEKDLAATPTVERQAGD